MLDVCLVRWLSDDWCVCVAGEWSVCVWKQKAGVQQWSLLYTWTFTQVNTHTHFLLSCNVSICGHLSLKLEVAAWLWFDVLNIFLFWVTELLI